MNGLPFNKVAVKVMVLKYMDETKILRKEKIFDNLKDWKLATILKEFKHFLNYEGEIVSIYIIFLLNFLIR